MLVAARPCSLRVSSVGCPGQRLRSAGEQHFEGRAGTGELGLLALLGFRQLFTCPNHPCAEESGAPLPYYILWIKGWAALQLVEMDFALQCGSRRQGSGWSECGSAPVCCRVGSALVLCSQALEAATCAGVPSLAVSPASVALACSGAAFQCTASLAAGRIYDGSWRHSPLPSPPLELVKFV